MTGLGGIVGGATDVDLLALAVEAAERGGRFIRDERPDDLTAAATKTSPTDVVTAMDTACERMLREHLLTARPQDGIVGEEGDDVVGTSGVTWVVDPIDGTVNYLYGIPQYAVCVAAVAGDARDPGGHEVLAGCVHSPVLGETWTAARGGGAYLSVHGRERRPVRVRDGAPLGQVLLATGFGYQAERRRHQAAVIAHLLPRVRDIRRIGCAALDICSVASGRADAYLERGLKPWDLAAAGLVAREAGALVTGLGAAPAGEKLVVAAGPQVHAVLQAELAPLRPDTDG
ncbi:MAG TPA: inositol monophosphatase family protein [Actinomycetales bacterium]|nr:inositol monophosphatase family protein [Actinomycetales bacterium]